MFVRYKLSRKFVQQPIWWKICLLSERKRDSTVSTRIDFNILAFRALSNYHPQILNTKMREGGFEGGIPKNPKGKNIEMLFSPTRGGIETEDKNVKKLNDFFA